MIEVKIFDDGKLAEEKSGDYILLFSADNEKVETYSAGGGPDLAKTFTGIAEHLAEIIPELGKEAGRPRAWTDLKIAMTAGRFMSHGMEYSAKLYSEETNEGSGQGMGAGVEPGEH